MTDQRFAPIDAHRRFARSRASRSFLARAAPATRRSIQVWDESIACCRRSAHDAVRAVRTRC